MARTSKNMSIYDRLNKNEQDIAATENLVKRLKAERKALLREKYNSEKKMENQGDK